jgi:uncharacterized spore protein YtfJ
VKIDELLSSARDAITVKRVFGDPYEKDDVTVLPAASVMGSGGGGSGTDEKGSEGGGGGFHVQGHPVGVYVIKGGDVRWIPAVDPAKLLAIAGFVVLMIVAIKAKTEKAHMKAAMRAAKRG